MRKGSFLLMLLLMAGSVALADRETPDPTLTQVAMPLTNPPVIDGVINGDEWLEAAGAQPGGTESYWRIVFNETAEDFVRGGENVSTLTDGPWGAEDFGMQIYVGYDADNLYVAVRAFDDIPFDDSAEAGSPNQNTWEDDSIEVFVDGDNSNFETSDTTGTNPEVVDTGGQFVISYNNAYREAEAGNPGYGEDQAWYALTSPRDNGYDAEFRISLETLGNPQPGDIIGFTVAQNDDDDGGSTTENQYIWVGRPHTEVSYGNLVLGPRRYSTPKVATAPTVDGTIADGEYDGAPEITINIHTGTYEHNSGDNAWEEGDHGFSAWVVHDDDAIYIAVDAIDDQIFTDSATAGSNDESTWEDDSIEVFIDADNSNTSGRDTSVLWEGQFVLTPNGASRDLEANDPAFGEDLDWYAATTETDTGYQVEFKILKFTVLEPEDGAVLGFNVSQNDDDGANRKAQINWSGYPHNEVSYGDLVLSSGAGVGEWSLH